MNDYFKRRSVSLAGSGLIITSLILGMVSCRHPQHIQCPGVTATIESSYGSLGETVLSIRNPKNEIIGAELVTITTDSATIRILNTDDYISAKTNTYFEGHGFGSHGLLLRWVSKEKGQIGVERFFCETEIR
jgi:hypothetical protein